ncbi:NAD(P)-dependent oxidoreductase [Streptomyces spinoverrucosus]|uniref:NAD(P)-dependent oxidoreductase n=1 Tax=Streptomyces spinoverrucosus TaxID=284043 RepID=UPI0018C44F04|nr:NAD(P)-binding domain-containing protein [Streptomyces spinoverrucosus]MBG0852254.1 NAD(P)-dependent oxidoreductase [Streptomyces spinoverrucosus]
MSDVSVLGLGLMGTAVASAIVEGGREVTVWNRTATKAEKLRERGAGVAESAVAAAQASPVVISVLTDSAALRTVLGDDVRLDGRTIVNLATGTPHHAIETDAWVRERGGRYLHGTIAAYPKDIGRPGGGVVFSGPAEIWNELEPTLLLLGGTTNHAGDNVGDACALDLGMLIFYMAAEGAFQEALAFASAYGVSPRRLLNHTLPTVAILERELRDSVDRVEKGDYSTDEATIDTFFACMELATTSSYDIGLRGPMTEGARKLYQRAVEAGRGADLPAALFPLLLEKPAPQAD